MSADRGAHSPAPGQALVTSVYDHDGLSLDYVAFNATVDGEMGRRTAQNTPGGRWPPGAPANSPDDGHARRVGTLFRLGDLLAAEGVLDGPFDDMGVQHRLQKCVYIAQRMGADMGYRFGFLGSGAFSTNLAIDVCHRKNARGGSDPFAGDPGRLEAFLGLVRGHTTEWLQVATFAMRPSNASLSRAEFVDRVAWNGSGYNRKRAAKVFDAVAALSGRLA